jgi:CheY-like chemotaxis protein
MARIFFIDDDSSLRQALTDSIRDFGHDVAEAANAEEALNLIEKADVAFLDPKMPQMSGTDFLRKAKPDIPASAGC